MSHAKKIKLEKRFAATDVHTKKHFGWNSGPPKKKKEYKTKPPAKPRLRPRTRERNQASKIHFAEDECTINRARRGGFHPICGVSKQMPRSPGCPKPDTCRPCPSRKHDRPFQFDSRQRGLPPSARCMGGSCLLRSSFPAVSE